MRRCLSLDSRAAVSPVPSGVPSHCLSSHLWAPGCSHCLHPHQSHGCHQNPCAGNTGLLPTLDSEKPLEARPVGLLVPLCPQCAVTLVFSQPSDHLSPSLSLSLQIPAGHLAISSLFFSCWLHLAYLPICMPSLFLLSSSLQLESVPYSVSLRSEPPLPPHAGLWHQKHPGWLQLPLYYGRALGTP